MSIDRLLQWTTASMAVVGALFLALSHENAWLPALLALAAVFTVSVTDVVPWLRLNRIAANVIAVSAVAWSLYDFLARSPEQQLMAISQMLVFLQVLLLFQEKNVRAYWQLLVLSLLQVVVAAALSSGPVFGFLLVVYMVLSLLALVLLNIYRGLRTAEREPPKSDAPSSPRWAALLAPPQAIPADGPRHTGEPSPGLRILTRQVAALALVTLAFTVVFFYTIPRLGEGAWQSPRTGVTGSGFMPEIKVEESGQIHASDNVVMRVVLTHSANRKPYALVGEPYFQGCVLTHYAQDQTGSRWFYMNHRNEVRVTPLPQHYDTISNVVRQDYVLELFGSNSVFAIQPVSRIHDTPPHLNPQRFTGRILRSDSGSHLHPREYRYAFTTRALLDGRQLRATPHANPAETFADVSLLDAELNDLRLFDSQHFPRLKAIAAGVLREAGVADSGPLAQAQVLERHFSSSGLYRYSLDLNFQRDRALDPIEDFVANHRTGHCEYFASGLVLMLRSQGIPARMVFGYKGGEYNMLGHYHIVRQKHAHTWVEAWMPPGAIPDSEIAGTPHQGGCWYRLDPTPVSSSGLAGDEEVGLKERLTDAFDYVELMWRDYVVNLTALRQKEAVIDPVNAGTLGALPAWVDQRRAQRWFRRLGERLGLPSGPRRSRELSRVFEWRAALFVAASLVVLIGMWHSGRFLIRRLSWWLGWKSGAKRIINQAPPFYLRLESVLRRLPLRRAAGQTARELAQEAGAKLASAAGQSGVARLPAVIVQAYYRVRFGGATLDNQEMAAIEQALVALEPAVSQAEQR